MAKQLKTEKTQQGNGVDPEKWESSPAEAVGEVSNASLASMTGGDAGTFEGIVDYILMEEERAAPNEQEIVASEQAGLLERNYPEEVETQATLEPHESIHAGTGIQTSQPTLGATNGGLEVGGLNGGDTSLDSLSAGLGDGMSSGGVGGVQFGSVSGLANISGGMEGGRVVDHKGDDAKVFKAMGGPDPQQLSAQNATVLAGMQGMVEGLAGQVDASVGGAMGSLASAYTTNDSCLDATFGANMSLIQGSFAQARSQVDASAADAQHRVEAKSAEALDKVVTGSRALLSDGDSLINTTTSTLLSQAASAESSALSMVTSAQGEAVAIANRWAAEARRVGDSKASGYRGRGSGGTEGKRNEARAQVAESYGEGYGEDLPNVGQEAMQTLEEEKANISSGIRELIRPLLEEELPALREHLRAEVNSAAEEARSSIQEGRDKANEDIAETHTQAGEQLSAAEAAATGDLQSTHQEAKVGLANMDEASQASIGAMGEGIREHLKEKVVQFRSVIAKNPALPLDFLQQEIGRLSGELLQQATSGQAAIDAAAQGLAEQQDAHTQDAVAGMNQIGQSAAESAAGISGQATTSLDGLASEFETGIDTLVDGFDSNLDALRTQLNQNVNAVLDTALNGLGTTLDGVRTGVQDFLNGFDADLGKSVNDDMVSAIESKAEEEAAKIKEPSVWDRVCSVVAVVLVVVAIVAITVVTAGIGTAIVGAIGASSLGLVASAALTVVAGAAVGAVSSALQSIVVQIATNGWNPADWNWREIGMDALVGGIVGGLTAGLGVGLKSLGQWGTRAVQSTAAVRGPLTTRLIQGAASLVDDAGKLSFVGDIAKSIGGDIIGQAAKAVKDGELPSLGEFASSIGLQALGTGLGKGIGGQIIPNESDAIQDSFTAYMEFITKEAATGSKTDEILEKLEVPVSQLGDLDLTMDYQPEWTPTW